MANFDEKTGIRYGVISPHSISSFALDDIYNNGTDPQYEMYKAELEARHKNGEIPIETLEDELETYESDGSGIMDYSDSEYDLHVSGDNFGIFVMRSPYYTYCRNCSPCAPGAGDLNASFDSDEHEITEGYHRALCLGPEWFDKGDDQYARKIPYRVFRVDNDMEVK